LFAEAQALLTKPEALLTEAHALLVKAQSTPDAALLAQAQALLADAQPTIVNVTVINHKEHMVKMCQRCHEIECELADFPWTKDYLVKYKNCGKSGTELNIYPLPGFNLAYLNEKFKEKTGSTLKFLSLFSHLTILLISLLAESLLVAKIKPMNLSQCLEGSPLISQMDSFVGSYNPVSTPDSNSGLVPHAFSSTSRCFQRDTDCSDEMRDFIEKDLPIKESYLRKS
jgi:hypothetical protein